MFLWVNDFYSLEKIKSAFPKIVLLYLKKSEKEGWGDWGEGIWAMGEGRNVRAISISSTVLSRELLGSKEGEGG